MATRAEQFRSEKSRRAQAAPSKTSTKKPKKSAWSRSSRHAGSKATHALEERVRGIAPSRESTRGSANRAKADVAMNLTEEKTKGSPANRARQFRAKGLRVRGSES